MSIRDQIRGIKQDAPRAGTQPCVPEKSAQPNVASQPEKSAAEPILVTGQVMYPEWAPLIDRANQILAVVLPHARQAVQDRLGGAIASVGPEGRSAFAEALAVTGRLARAILRARLVVPWLRSPGFSKVERDMADRLGACLEPDLLDQAPEVRQGFVRDVATAWNGYKLDLGPLYGELPAEVRDEA